MKKETIIKTEEKRKCFMCGLESNHTKMELSNDICLDLLPRENPLEYIMQKYELCPHCGYETKNIETKPSLDDKLNSIKIRDKEEYMKIFKSEILSKEEKLLLLELMRQEKYNYVGGIKFDLFMFYDSKNDNFKKTKYLNEHIRVIEKKISVQRAKMGLVQQDIFLATAIEDYYMLIECNRRAGYFEKALEHIVKFDKIKFSKENKHYKAKIDMQKKLCKKKISERK